MLNKNQAFFRKVYQSFMDYPAQDPQQQSQQAVNPYHAKSSQYGINFFQFNEILKILGFFPAIIAKHEISSIFI